jgi:hypothetical protein
MFGIMMIAQIIGGIFGVLLVWMSLYNRDGQIGYTPSPYGGVPESEILLLLPNEPDVTIYGAF